MIVQQLDPKFAPGCFGGALMFEPEAPECRSCPFAQACGPKSIERTEIARRELGIDPARLRVTTAAKKKAVDPTTALTTELPKKVQELLRRIEASGIKVTETVARGENPFKQGFLKVACHLLIKRDDPESRIYGRAIDRSFLTAAFTHQFGWPETTARPHATLAFQVLQALGAAVETNGKLQLKR